MLNAYTLLFLQALAHLSAFFLIFNGEAWQWGVVLCIYFLNGCIGMTATYHRLLSHRSWICPKWLERFGVLCATIGLTGSAISWAAVHRKHHRFVDSPSDPHSPAHKGFFYCQWFTMFEKVELKYVGDLLRDPFLMFQHRYYIEINIVFGFFLYLIDPLAVLYAWLVPACILWNGGSSINTFSHLFGSKSHSLNSQARNSLFLGIMVWGEGWHNNHHFDSKNPKFGESFWQVDCGYYYIKLVGLALRFSKNK